MASTADPESQSMQELVRVEAEDPDGNGADGTSPTLASLQQHPGESKRRWTREEKELRNARKRFEQAINARLSSVPPHTSKKTKRPPLSSAERLLQCAERARHTRSVQVQQLNTEISNDKDYEHHVHVQTYCRQAPSASLTSLPPSTTHLIHVQPLLILDLNGILCHRIRHRRHGTHYRPSAAHIANTPIVPRVDLQPFLSFLDQHFCLAVWTSAKPKTAKQLVHLLFPPPIRERLLFVWTQTRCHVLPRKDRPDGKPLFQKPLHKVWKDFGLWNATNTYLMDDSPQKCDMQYSTNTLHPPPLHGAQHYHHHQQQQQQQQYFGHHPDHGRTLSNDSYPHMTDLENEERQIHFFQRFVRQLDGGTVSNTSDDRGGGVPLAFLEQHARGHMGWRGPSTNRSTSAEAHGVFGSDEMES